MKQERLEATDETVEPARESGIFADLAVRQTSELPRAEGRSIPPPPPPTRSSILPVARRAEAADPELEGFEATDAQEAQDSDDELLEHDELDAGDAFEEDEKTPNQVMTKAGLMRPGAAPASTGRTLPPPPPRQSAPSLPGTSFPKAQPSAHQHTIPPGIMAVSPLVANAAVAFPATQPMPRDTSGTYQKVEPASQVEPVRASYVAAPQAQAALAPTPSQVAPHALDAPYGAVAARTASSQVPYAMLIVGALIAACFAWYMLAAKAVPGVVQLTTAPADADVLFDGVKVGSVSPFLKTGVEPGVKHTLEVKKSGFRTWAQEVEVQSGQTLIFTVALPSEASADAPSVAPVSAPVVPAPAPAVAEPAPVAAEPSAVAAPMPTAAAAARAVQAPPDAAPVKAAPAAAPSARRASASSPSAAAKPSAAARPSAAASGATGTLRVSARPWAVVTIDGKLIGNTPQMNLTLSEGSHRVELSNPEFNVQKVMTVSIQAGKVETLIVNLL